jgi:hypothetical protein
MSSVAVLMMACLGLVEPDPAKANDTAADSVTLRDGQVARGEVVEPGPRGSMSLIVRREWAKTHLKDWEDRWEAAEAPHAARALAQRRERLESWKRERSRHAPEGPDDRISSWIDREIERLRDAGPASKSPLLLVKLNRGDARSVSRAPKGLTRLIRLGWTSGFADPETLSVADLKNALEGRGFDLTSTRPVSIDALLPLQPESDAAWLVRRAATEVSFDSGLRFVRHAGLVLPEPASGQPLAPGTGLMAISALKDLLGDNPVDPLTARLREVSARGKVGAVVTKLDVAPDFATVSVEMTLWVRQAGERWIAAGSRSARVRPDELAPDAGNDLADDPQVALAFQAIEAIGLGSIPRDLKQRSLNIGAATRRALGQARTLAEADLSTLALPVRDQPKERERAPARP